MENVKGGAMNAINFYVGWFMMGVNVCQMEAISSSDQHIYSYQRKQTFKSFLIANHKVILFKFSWHLDWKNKKSRLGSPKVVHSNS